jgi:hypothetical protein
LIVALGFHPKKNLDNLSDERERNWDCGQYCGERAIPADAGASEIPYTPH